MGFFLGMQKMFPPGVDREELLRRMAAEAQGQQGGQMVVTPNQPLGPGAFDPVGISPGVQRGFFGGIPRPSLGPRNLPSPPPEAPRTIDAAPSSVRYGPPPGLPQISDRSTDLVASGRGALDNVPAEFFKPEAPRRPNFLQRIGRGLGDAARNGDLALIIGGMQAAAAGDSSAQARYNLALHEQRMARRTAQAAGERRQSYQNNMTKPRELGGYGMDPGAAELAMGDPESFAREYNTQFRTREVSPGTGVYQPQPGGQPQTWTQPTMIAQQAREAGLQPGTEAYNRFMQDAVLNAQGPTGVQMQREGFTNAQTVAGIAAGAANWRHTTPGAPTPQAPRSGPPSPNDIVGGILSKVQAGETLTPGEQQIYDRWRQGTGAAARGRGRAGQPFQGVVGVVSDAVERGRGAAAAAPSAPQGGSQRGGGGGRAATAVNPQTGQRIYLRGGRWVDEQGRPVN